MELGPIAVAVPLLCAAGLAMAMAVTPRPVAKLVAVVASATTLTLCVILLVRAASGTHAYWLGGWRPTHDVAIGISFTVDAVGAALATFVAVLMTAALTFSWRYLDEERPYFAVLMLVFLAGMTGFCLAGDIFTMFVLFEVMSVAAYSLTAYKRDLRAPLAGALNFGITNSVGSFLVLFGIGLLYGRTGALNLAQIGQALSIRGADGLVIVSFALLASGFFVKTAVVPFHFWLADAYAVAPAPVCMLFAGVMSELGLYAIARIYFSAFSGVLAPSADALTTVLLVAGCVTALLGAVMAFRQDHLKRLIAFATISSIGTALIGLSLLSEDGAAAAGVYVLGDGFAKAALFAGVGILQHRFGSVSERRLRGEGRSLRSVGVMFALAALAIAALPPFGPFLGKAMIEDALVAHGRGWAIVVVVMATALTGGALLRAAGRVFGGLGPKEPEKVSPADRETEVEAPEIAEGSPFLMRAVTGFLLACTLATGCWFGLADAATAAATHFTDAAGYAAAVFGGHPPAPPVEASDAPRWFDWLLAVASVAGALVIAAIALFYPRFRRGRPRLALVPIADRPLRLVEGLHSGHVGDYVAWLTAGLAVFGAAFALALS